MLVGPNGAGKTTLMATLAGERKPAAGSVRLGHNAKVGYLSQHAETAAGDGTVLEAAARETGLAGQKVRDLLGLFLFSGNDVNKQLSDISGGEQRRLSLAILVASGANLLLLDEPTNHLDIESREALEDALLGFPGALILISHDRALLEAVGSRTLVCENGKLTNHMSGWAEYQRQTGRDARKPGSRPPARARPPRPTPAGVVRPARRSPGPGAGPRTSRPGSNGPRRPWPSSRTNSRIPPPGRPRRRPRRSTRRHQKAKDKVSDLYEEWEEADRIAREMSSPAS